MSEETMEREYWCHGCQKTVTCTEEVLCVLCGSPFIEEVHYQRHFDVPSFLHESDMTQLTERLHMIYSMLREMRSLSFDIEEVGSMQDEEIDDIPTVERLQDQCAICLEAHEDVVRALPCNHTYHETCLRKWLKMKAICPTCKRPIRNPRLNAHFE